MKLTLATYQKSFAWLGAALIICVVALPPYATFWFDEGRLLNRLRAHGELWIVAIAIAWVLDAITFLILVAYIRQLLFDRYRALWIEDGELIGLNRLVFRVPLRDIKQAVASRDKSLFRRSAIALQMYDGSEKLFLTGGLSESCDAIVTRFNVAKQSMFM